jgi:hypothetical protein
VRGVFISEFAEGSERLREDSEIEEKCKREEAANHQVHGVFVFTLNVFL